jgi:hypothetical protein
MKFSDLRTEFGTSSFDAFGRKYGHPWLVIQLSLPKTDRWNAFTTEKNSGHSALDLAAANADPNWLPHTTLLRFQDLDDDTLDFRPIVTRSAEVGGKDHVAVGRAVDNDIVIRDRSVSKAHARIGRTNDGSWVLQAYQSLNATKVNMAVVDPSTEPVRLSTGTRIELGNVLCHFIERDDFLSLFTQTR